MLPNKPFWVACDSSMIFEFSALVSASWARTEFNSCSISQCWCASSDTVGVSIWLSTWKHLWRSTSVFWNRKERYNYMLCNSRLVVPDFCTFRSTTQCSSHVFYCAASPRRLNVEIKLDEWLTTRRIFTSYGQRHRAIKSTTINCQSFQPIKTKKSQSLPAQCIAETRWAANDYCAPPHTANTIVSICNHHQIFQFKNTKNLGCSLGFWLELNPWPRIIDSKSWFNARAHKNHGIYLLFRQYCWCNDFRHYVESIFNKQPLKRYERPNFDHHSRGFMHIMS